MQCTDTDNSCDESQIGESGPMLTAFVLPVSVSTAGAALPAPVTAISAGWGLYRIPSVVAGNVNWAYASSNEWASAEACTGSAAFCYSYLACVALGLATCMAHLTRHFAGHHTSLRA